MPVKVITDSASNLYKEILEQYDIDMISMNYNIDGSLRPCYDFNQSYEEQGKEFYDALRNGAKIKTSLASPNAYFDLFKKYLEQGYDIFYTSISSKLSGTLNSANNAKAMLESEYPNARIVCMDSLSASFGEGIIAIEAAKLAKEGKDLSEIVKTLGPIRLNVRNEFTVGDLKYLKAGGRIQSLLYAIGSLLEIKPMLRASKEASIELCGKVLGRKKSLRRLAETVKETIEKEEEQTLYIAHCDCLEDAKLLEKWIKEMVGSIKNVVVSMYDFCTGAHVGPGAIAVFYYGKARA